jgi:hypothetical protein
MDGSSAKGPTLSSSVGIVKLKDFPSVDVSAMSIVAVRVDILSHGIP